MAKRARGRDPVWILQILVFLAATGVAEAVQFDVNSSIDATDASPGDGVCASSAGACTLRAAVQEANRLDGTDRIELPAGTYRLQVTGVDEDAAASGDLDITSELGIFGAGAAITIIDAGGIDRVVDVLAPGIAVITGLSLRGGGRVIFGGGVRNGNVLALNACVVEGNGVGDAPVRFGGGIANIGSLTMAGCTVRGNSASGSGTTVGAGGGIYSLVLAQISASRIVNNTATGAGSSGGGFFARAQSLTRIGTTTIDGNAANIGGGLSLIDGSLYLTTSTVSQNFANGGAVDAGGGGGIRVGGGSAVLVNSTVSGNTANRDGGGIALASGSLDLRSTTLSNNITDFNGDGTGDGGGLHVASGFVARARNSVLGANVDGGVRSAPDCSGSLASDGNVWIHRAAGCALATQTGDVINRDPLLRPLADYGGPTLTHALAPVSGAIDAGNRTGCLGYTLFESEPEPVDVLLVVDQRLRPRAIDGNGDRIVVCDIGAYEFGAEESDRIFRDGFEG